MTEQELTVAVDACCAGVLAVVLVKPTRRPESAGQLTARLIVSQPDADAVG